MTPLAPSGAVVDASVAALIIRQQSYQREADMRTIAGLFGTSLSTVERVIEHHDALLTWMTWRAS